MTAKSKTVKRLERIAAQIHNCTRCPLHASRIHAVPGDGPPSAQLMIVGEAPGREEDESGHPFVGAAGRFLNHLLEKIGLRRDDFFITNVVKCRPPGNRTPKKDEIETCTTLYLFKQIELLNPKLIVVLGSVAARSLLGVERVAEARGRVIERDGRKYLVSYHPAGRFYREDLEEKIEEDFHLLKQVVQEIS